MKLVMATVVALTPLLLDIGGIQAAKDLAKPLFAINRVTQALMTGCSIDALDPQDVAVVKTLGPEVSRGIQDLQNDALLPGPLQELCNGGKTHIRHYEK